MPSAAVCKVTGVSFNPLHSLRQFTDFYTRHYRSTYGVQSQLFLLNHLKEVRPAEEDCDAMTYFLSKSC